MRTLFTLLLALGLFGTAASAAELTGTLKQISETGKFR